MARYQCSECQFMQDTGRVCGRCGSYSLEPLQTHSDTDHEDETHGSVRADSNNMPVWLSLFGIAMLTSYLLLFHM